MEGDFILYNEHGPRNPAQSFPTKEAALEAAAQKLERHPEAGHFHVMQRVATMTAKTTVTTAVEETDQPVDVDEQPREAQTAGV